MPISASSHTVNTLFIFPFSEMDYKIVGLIVWAGAFNKLPVAPFSKFADIFVL